MINKIKKMLRVSKERAKEIKPTLGKVEKVYFFHKVYIYTDIPHSFCKRDSPTFGACYIDQVVLKPTGRYKLKRSTQTGEITIFIEHHWSRATDLWIPDYAIDFIEEYEEYEEVFECGK